MDAARRRGPLDCTDADAAFADRLEGTLGDDRRLAFDAHLAACPGCETAYAGYAAAVAAARAACRAEEAEPIPEDLVTAILAARRSD